MSEPAIPAARAVLRSSGELRRYETGGGARPAALLAVVIASIVAGCAAGVALGYISHWFSIVLLYSIVIGGAAGGAAAFMIGKLSVRAPWLALLLGVIGATAGYIASHYGAYLHFRPLLVNAGGFRTYLDLAAAAGISIKQVGSSSTAGPDFTGTAAWIYWGVELLFAVCFAGWIARSRAREPFCASCSSWFGPQYVVRGGPASKATVQEIERLLVGNLPDQAAGAFVGDNPMAEAHLELVARQCTKCQADVHCVLRSAVRKSNRTDYKTFEEFLLAKPEATTFLDSIQRRKSARA